MIYFKNYKYQASARTKPLCLEVILLEYLVQRLVKIRVKNLHQIFKIQLTFLLMKVMLKLNSLIKIITILIIKQVIIVDCKLN